MKKRIMQTFSFALIGLLLSAVPAIADIKIGVAAGFLNPLNALIAEYDPDGDYDWTVTYSDMTTLRNNIIAGFNSPEHESPYDILLSANTAIPKFFVDTYPQYVLTDDFDYAVGKLVAWSFTSAYDISSDPQATISSYVNNGNTVVTCTLNGSYGQAAMDILGPDGYAINPNNIYHEAIMGAVVADIMNQTYPIGFVGNAQVCDVGTGSYRSTGSYVNSTYYTYSAGDHDTSLVQAGVDFIRGGQDTTTIADFIKFIRGQSPYSELDGPDVIEDYCYDLPPQPQE